MTVVVGVDGSRGSVAAIRLAAREARYRSAPLLAVMAYSGESTLGAPAPGRWPPCGPPRTSASSSRSLSATSSGTRSAIRQARWSTAWSREIAGRALVEAARTAGAELIVLSTRGEGGVSLLLGAVSQYVLRHAPCPVLVVPHASKDL